MDIDTTTPSQAQSLHDLTPEHLKCSICYEVFTDPHFAGCGKHAFCKGCLDSLAAASAGATGGGGGGGSSTTSATQTPAVAAVAQFYGRHHERSLAGDTNNAATTTSSTVSISCPHCR
jgi:hypothetical protein